MHKRKPAGTKSFTMFNGESKRQKQISLGGRSKNRTRGSKQLLADAAAKREAREKSRKQNNSSRRVQSVWRSFSARKHKRRGLRQGWDTSIAQLSALENAVKAQTGQAANFVDAQLTSFLRQLIFFYRPSEDPEDFNRLALQCSFLVRNTIRPATSSAVDPSEIKNIYDGRILTDRNSYKVQVVLFLRQCYDCLASYHQSILRNSGRISLNSNEIQSIHKVIRHFTDDANVGAHINTTSPDTQKMVSETVNHIVRQSCVVQIPSSFTGKGLFTLLKELIQLELLEKAEDRARASLESDLADTFPPIVAKALGFEDLRAAPGHIGGPERSNLVDLTGVEDDIGKPSQCELDLYDSVLATPGALLAPSFSRIFRCLLENGCTNDGFTQVESKDSTTSNLSGREEWKVFKSVKWRKLVFMTESVMTTIAEIEKSDSVRHRRSNQSVDILNIGANIIHLVNATVSKVCSEFTSSKNSLNVQIEDDLHALVSYVSIMKMTVGNIPPESFSKSKAVELASSYKDMYFKVLEDVLSRSFVKGLFDILLPQRLGSEMPTKMTPEMKSLLNSTLSTACELYCDLIFKSGGSPTTSVARLTTPKEMASGHTRDLLNMLGWGELSFLNRMWRHLCEKYNANAYEYYSTPKIEEIASSWGAILNLFCTVFDNLLLFLDDEQFYVHQFPFQHSDLPQIVKFLLCLLHRMYWSDRHKNTPSSVMSSMSTDIVEEKEVHANASTSSNEALLRIVTTRLLNQLYDRNCRRPFTTPSEWHWPKEVWAGISEKDALPDSNLQKVLSVVPQVVDFDARLRILRNEIRMNKQSSQANVLGGLEIRVKRDQIYEDSYSQLSGRINQLKSRLKIVIMNEQGIVEDGIDGGGLFREFMDLLAKRAFDPQYSLFIENHERFLYPNPSSKIAFMDVDDGSEASRNDLSHFYFAGAIIGKAVYEELLIEPQFANFFLNRLLGKFNYTDDLQSLDPELYHNLMYLKSYEGDFDDLGLTFTVSQDQYGEQEEIELCPGGGSRNVDSSNVREYITRMAQYRLKHQINMQSAAFAEGFHSLIDSRWILMFNPDELRMIISGTHQVVDIADLRKHTQYAGGYYEEEDAIQWFWEILEGFSAEDKAALLKFVTSCSRQPLLGFSQLYPNFCVQRTEESDKLPTAATCMNILKLPQYSNKETMKQKLLYAINAGAGFDLT